MNHDGMAASRYRYLERPGKGARRDRRPSHLRWQGYRGRWECELVAWTPLEAGGIADVLDGTLETVVGSAKKQRPSRGRKPGDEFKPFHVDPVRVPGTSLKGMIRALAEFAEAGCYRVGKDVLGKWAACDGLGDQVCACCDMFGLVAGGDSGNGIRALRGKVRIGDATLVGDSRKARMNPLRANRYPPRRRRSIPGRAPQKFFLHEEWDDRAWAGRRGNAEFYTVRPGSRFRFTVTFESLDARELALLDWCLFLQPGLLHKLGKGKAIGLGSVGIRPLRQELERVDGAWRPGGEPGRWEAPPEEAVLRDHADERLPDEVLAERRKIVELNDLRDLREVMRWPGVAGFEPIPFPAAATPGPRGPDGPPITRRERWIREARIVYRPQTQTFEATVGEAKCVAGPEVAQPFYKGLSKKKQKQAKGEGVPADIRVRDEGNKHEILEIRPPGEGGDP